MKTLSLLSLAAVAALVAGCETVRQGPVTAEAPMTAPQVVAIEVTPPSVTPPASANAPSPLVKKGPDTPLYPVPKEKPAPTPEQPQPVQPPPAPISPPPVVSEAETRSAVQVTELGCLRVLLLLDSSAMESEKLIAQRLSDVDFRLFPAAASISGRVDPEIMKQRGKEQNADLVFYATVSTRLKSKLQDFQLKEGEATVQIYSPITGELLVSHTARANGERQADELEADRTARERVVDTAVREAVAKSLAKAHKMLVYRAALTGVKDHQHLLAIMEYVQRLPQVYHVRQLTFDTAKHEAAIEIVASPKAESFWRPHLQNLPRTVVTVVTVDPNQALREKYPGWFTPQP